MASIYFFDHETFGVTKHYRESLLILNLILGYGQGYSLSKK